MYSPQTAGQVKKSSAVLHNVMMSEGYPLPSSDEIEDQLEDKIEDGVEDNDEDEDREPNLTQHQIQQAGLRIRK